MVVGSEGLEFIHQFWTIDKRMGFAFLIAALHLKKLYN